MVPAWLHALSLLSLALGVALALVVVIDELRRPQMMWIMNVVWPVVALFGTVITLWGYFTYGRLATHEKAHKAIEQGRDPPAQPRTAGAPGAHGDAAAPPGEVQGAGAVGRAGGAPELPGRDDGGGITPAGAVHAHRRSEVDVGDDGLARRRGFARQQGHDRNVVGRCLGVRARMPRWPTSNSTPRTRASPASP